MGRTIASVTQRLESKLGDWKEYAEALPRQERAAFLDLVREAKNHRTEIDAAGEADISIAILLSMVTHLKGELNAKRTDLTKGLENWAGGT